MNDPNVVEPTEVPDENPTDLSSENNVPSSRNEVAREVLAGLWGRGNKRIEKLKAAGHDPIKVQGEVDKILKGE